MKYPIIKGNDVLFRKGGNCTCCRKKNNGNFVTLNGGVIAVYGKSFLTINKVSRSEMSKTLDICNNEGLGQFEFYFCSTKCLRSFLNQIVDDFEKL